MELKYNRNKQYQIRLEDEREFMLPHSEETGEKIQQWIAAGELVTIHSNEPTLEKVFLELTGRELL
ncbi:hypothetical protein [Bacillus sp. SJS]|uniref:hypothetical protein n=1 Tax=Bacillus sp. SJS TaxID=1423321 RepID=UPI002692C8D0